MKYYTRQNPKEPSPPLAHVSKSRQEFPGSPRGRTLGQLQPDQLSPEPGTGLDQKSLMAALHSYVTQNLSAQSSERSPHSRTKGSQVYAERLYSTQVSPFDGTFAKGKAEDFNMRKLFQPRPGVLRPTPEMLSHKSASQDDPKDPLSIVDGKVDIYLSLLT